MAGPAAAGPCSAPPPPRRPSNPPPSAPNRCLPRSRPHPLLCKASAAPGQWHHFPLPPALLRCAGRPPCFTRCTARAYLVRDPASRRQTIPRSLLHPGSVAILVLPSASFPPTAFNLIRSTPSIAPRVPLVRTLGSGVPWPAKGTTGSATTHNRTLGSRLASTPTSARRRAKRRAPEACHRRRMGCSVSVAHRRAAEAPMCRHFLTPGTSTTPRTSTLLPQ